MRDLENSGDLASLNSKSLPIDSANESSPAGSMTEARNDLDELVSDFLNELHRLSDGQESARRETLRAAEFITVLKEREPAEYPRRMVEQSIVPLSSGTPDEFQNLQAGMIRGEARPPLFQYGSDGQVKNRWIRPVGWLLVLGTLVVGVIAVYSIHFKKWKLIMGKPAVAATLPPAVAMSPPKPSLQAATSVVAAENRPNAASPAVSTTGGGSPGNSSGSTGTQAGDQTQRSATVRSKQAAARNQTRPAATTGGAIPRPRGSDRIVGNSPPTAAPAPAQHTPSPTMPALTQPASAPQAAPPLSTTSPAPANPGNAVATVVPASPPPERGLGVQPPTVSMTAPAAAEEKPAVPATPTGSLPDLSKGGESLVAAYKPPTPAVVARKVSPTYPPAAKTLGIRRVELDVEVNEEGQVVNAVAVSGPPILRIPSEAALKKWQFIPASRNGVHIKSTVRVSIMFTP